MDVMTTPPLKIIVRLPFTLQAQMQDEKPEKNFTRGDFLGALDELENLTRTKQIADHLDCSEETAEEWVLKLEEEEGIVSKKLGDRRLIWVKKTDQTVE